MLTLQETQRPETQRPETQRPETQRQEKRPEKRQETQRPEFIEPFLKMSTVNKTLRRIPIIIRRDKDKDKDKEEEKEDNCKRKFENSFNSEIYEDGRYGQHISPDYFKQDIGHGVFQNVKEEKDENYIDPELCEKINVTYEWCLEYLRTKFDCIK